MHCDHALFLITSCAHRAVPVRVRNAIVRVATRQAGIAAVSQVAEHPRSPDARRRRVAVEGCLWGHHTTHLKYFVIFHHNIRGLRPLLPFGHSPRFTQPVQVRPQSRASTRSKRQSSSGDTPSRHRRRQSSRRTPTQPRRQTPPGSR